MKLSQVVVAVDGSGAGGAALMSRSLIALCFLALPAAAQQSPPIAIRNVTVIAMSGAAPAASRASRAKPSPPARQQVMLRQPPGASRLRD